MMPGASIAPGELVHQPIAIEARSVVKSYGRGAWATRALSGIDLTVPRGRIVAVMGPSGSGKSTLLHVLAGLAVPDSGEVLIDGVALSTLDDDSRSRLRRRDVGVIFQFFNLLPLLTVADNVALPAIVAGDGPRAYMPAVAEALESVGMASLSRRLATDLSGGEQQRVAVARALFANPSVLLADEPTGNLDRRSGAEVLSHLVRARRELGRTIILVTHDPRVASVSDEVIMIQDGCLIAALELGRDDDIDTSVGSHERMHFVIKWLGSGRNRPRRTR